MYGDDKTTIADIDNKVSAFREQYERFLTEMREQHGVIVDFEVDWSRFKDYPLRDRSMANLRIESEWKVINQ